MVRVVEFDVGEHAEGCAELHQGAVRFIRLRHQQPAFAMATVAAKGGHDAANHCGGVVFGSSQQGGDQGAGSGFAMAPGYGDGVLAIDQGGQHVGAVADRQTHATGLQ